MNGYANGSVAAPTYEQVCTGATGHAEAVRVTYAPAIVSLKTLVEQLFAFIDLLSVNRQGNDVGSRYRTGVYFTDPADEPVIGTSQLESSMNPPPMPIFTRRSQYSRVSSIVPNAGSVAHVE